MRDAPLLWSKIRTEAASEVPSLPSSVRDCLVWAVFEGAQLGTTIDHQIKLYGTFSQMGAEARHLKAQFFGGILDDTRGIIRQQPSSVVLISDTERPITDTVTHSEVENDRSLEDSIDYVKALPNHGASDIADKVLNQSNSGVLLVSPSNYTDADHGDKSLRIVDVFSTVNNNDNIDSSGIESSSKNRTHLSSNISSNRNDSDTVDTVNGMEVDPRRTVVDKFPIAMESTESVDCSFVTPTASNAKPSCQVAQVLQGGAIMNVDPSNGTSLAGVGTVMSTSLGMASFNPASGSFVLQAMETNPPAAVQLQVTGRPCLFLDTRYAIYIY